MELTSRISMPDIVKNISSVSNVPLNLIDSVFCFLYNKKYTESMVKIFSLIRAHLFNQKDEIYHLITWFLNLLIENEAFLQSGAKSYERTDSINLVETTTNLEITKINMESSSY